MVKKNKNQYFEDDDVIVIDKKTKRRLERQRAKEEQQRQQAEQREAEEASIAAAQASQEEEVADDAMSQIARLCQENNWREAVLTCRGAIKACQEEGKEDMLMPLSFALVKLEMSLRRQMVAAFVAGAQELLKKEYLLNVGEE